MDSIHSEWTLCKYNTQSTYGTSVFFAIFMFCRYVFDILLLSSVFFWKIS